eukprot:8372880-Pyramimonas_sp.AAC.1
MHCNCPRANAGFISCAASMPAAAQSHSHDTVTVQYSHITVQSQHSTAVRALTPASSVAPCPCLPQRCHTVMAQSQYIV